MILSVLSTFPPSYSITYLQIFTFCGWISSVYCIERSLPLIVFVCWRRVLLRVRMLYYLKVEVLGEAANQALEGTAARYETPPQSTSAVLNHLTAVPASSTHTDTHYLMY